MKIAVGKLGRSVLFNPKHWGVTGGDNEAPKFYENLFLRNPDIDFYLVGITDFCRLDEEAQNRINAHGNVHDLWGGFKAWNKQFYFGDERGDRITYMQEVIMKQLPEMDAGLFFAGPTATSNVFGKARKVTDPENLAKPLMMQCKYAGPIIDYINETNIPWAMILNDPRFYPANMKDLFNRPQFVLSQYNETIMSKAWKSFTEMERDDRPVPSTYEGVETIFLIGQEQEVDINTEKDIKFMVVCNEGRPSRYKDLKKYILDHVDDVDIYGKWTQEILNSDERFKGPKPFHELQDMLPRVKYTFCIPIKKGWATSKFWEMAHYGIIPFLHPDYDEQNNLQVHDFFRVKDSQDLFNKIEWLEADPERYETVRGVLQNMLKEEYYTGEFMNGLALQTINRLTRSPISSN